MIQRLTPTQFYTKVSQLIWIYSVQSAKTMSYTLHVHKTLGHSKGGLVLVQKFLYSDPYQRYEETFVGSNWAHLTYAKILSEKHTSFGSTCPLQTLN